MDQKRIEYIDALRGLAILSVVFMHVPIYGCQGIGGMYYVMTTRLAVPLFFFISGYLSSCKITPRILEKLTKGSEPLWCRH